MIKYVIKKSTLETDKYHDPKNPWIIVSVDSVGEVLPNSLEGRYPSNRMARRKIRGLVQDRAGKRS